VNPEIKSCGSQFSVIKAHEAGLYVQFHKPGGLLNVY